jgi:acetylornithine deacetylase
MPPMALTEREREVVEDVARRRDELVELLRALVAFDTVTHTPESPAREEAALQCFLGHRLAARGAEVRVAEPESALVAGHPMVPDGFSFAGRPQLVARFAGTGGGRTLLLNGHVDVVDAEPRTAWSVDPFAAVIRDGAVWGRGACDMKGGVACMVLAAEVLAEQGGLAGDLVVNTVTEEESTGAGGLASARTISADAAIVPEPTRGEVWIACRGSLLSRITVEGRAGHAGIPPRHPDEGGAVNAIEKTAYLIEAIRRLREEWTLRPGHPHLSPADCVPTMIGGGQWLVSHPASCRLDCHIEFLPDATDAAADAGASVQREFEEWIARAAAADPWLCEHPPRVEWLAGAVPPAEISREEPVVTALLSAEADLGRTGRVGGLDNWHDGATLIVEAGIPAVCYGPGDVHLAHGADELVPITDLVACAQGIALAALRFCGTDAGTPAPDGFRSV